MAYDETRYSLIKGDTVIATYATEAEARAAFDALEASTPWGPNVGDMLMVLTPDWAKIHNTLANR